MNTSHPGYALFSRRQLKIQGLLWLGILAEISLMALLVREVRPGPVPPASAWDHPDSMTAKAFPQAPLLTSLP